MFGLLKNKNINNKILSIPTRIWQSWWNSCWTDRPSSSRRRLDENAQWFLDETGTEVRSSDTTTRTETEIVPFRIRSDWNSQTSRNRRCVQVSPFRWPSTTLHSQWTHPKLAAKNASNFKNIFKCVFNLRLCKLYPFDASMQMSRVLNRRWTLWNTFPRFVPQFYWSYTVIFDVETRVRQSCPPPHEVTLLVDKSRLKIIFKNKESFEFCNPLDSVSKKIM